MAYTVIVHRPWLYAMTVRVAGPIVGFCFGLFWQIVFNVHPFVVMGLMAASSLGALTIACLAQPLRMSEIRWHGGTANPPRRGPLGTVRSPSGFLLHDIEQAVAAARLTPESRAEVMSLLAARLQDGGS